MERNIITHDFNWAEFFEKAKALQLEQETLMRQARDKAEEIEPEQFGELSDLLAKFRILVLSGHYLSASREFDKIRGYYAGGTDQEV